MNIQKGINDLLISGTDDWLHIDDITSAAELIGADTDEKVRDFSIRLIREVLEQDFMDIGDLVEEEPHFRNWNLTVEEAVKKVNERWDSLPKDFGRKEPLCGDICWFQSTSKGYELGRRLLEEQKNLKINKGRKDQLDSYLK